MKNLGRAITLPQLIELLQNIVEVHGDTLAWTGDDSGALTIEDTDGETVGIVHSENS